MHARTYAQHGHRVCLSSRLCTRTNKHTLGCLYAVGKRSDLFFFFFNAIGSSALVHVCVRAWRWHVTRRARGGEGEREQPPTLARRPPVLGRYSGAMHCLGCLRD